MAINIFGWQFGKVTKDKETLKSFTAPDNTDGAVVVGDGSYYGGAYTTSMDFDGSMRSENELVTKYREIAMTPEFEMAINNIVNEAIVHDGNTSPVSINLEYVNIPDKIKDKIIDEFDNIIRMLNFKKDGHEIFRKWYIDGRLYYHMIIDSNNPRKGIREARYIDPRKIRKIREEIREKSPTTPLGSIVTGYREYYIYNERGILDSASNDVSSTGTIMIAPDCISHTHSGVMDPTNRFMVSYIHKAIKTYNQLRTMEDSVVLARFTRAPMRRVFYIDVGSLPKQKAEQYLMETMRRHRQKTVYDANTGEIRNDKQFMTMLEDYWFARREGGRTTEVDTLQGDGTLSDVSDVNYFKEKLYEALSVPISRIKSDSTFNLGRSSEITRDEVMFSKFIGKLRNKFSGLFNSLLMTQLILKGILSKEDWEEIENDITYVYSVDNFFAELKDNEILTQRVQLLDTLKEHVGVYYSREWVRRHVLQQYDKDIEEMDKQIATEKQNDLINNQVGQPGDGSDILNFDTPEPRGNIQNDEDT